MLKFVRTGFTSKLFALSVSAIAFGGIGSALPASADTNGATHTPQHVWVDSTQPDVNGDYSWTVTIHMPPLTGNAIIHQQVPDFVDGAIDCQTPDLVDGGVLSCVGAGNPIPGEYSVAIDLKQEGGPGYAWSVPLTVCPLTGCSDLFSLTISPNPMVIWANPTITEQTFGQYDFNIDWNPLEVRIDELRDAQGNIAPGIYDPRSEIPADGSQFNYHGTFTVPGYYFGTITMIDEFGGEHDAPYTVRVCTPETCADLLALPDTGVDAVAIAAGAAFAVLAVGAGAFMLIVRRRKS